MKAPSISIVMPVYNSSRYLSESIDSILSQTFSDFELIIIDDGSTDGSREIITTNYKDSRIRLIKNEHNFIQSLNIGMTQSKGKYIARMDADDIMLPERLQMQYHFMEENPDIDISGTWMQVFGDMDGIWKNTTASDEIEVQAILHSPLYHPTVILKRSIITQFPLVNDTNQVYNEEYIYAEDYQLWTELMKRGYRLTNLPHVLLRYRKSEGQISRQKQTEMQNTTLRIQTEYLEYIMDKIAKLDEDYYNMLDHSITLCNKGKVHFIDLQKIVYIIASRVIPGSSVHQ
ncbi:glycosyl transferase family 2 [Dysgonomonas alginatilytica]|uniref:Glycosyl transferase family 2 n=1 Tax=Dysgonomonas alginatilytica TaxID=1605892 RepID=A0A2V3PXL7_9BACT|nr:glycosyltransferase [Dysgonomonas alginatilytica]PXV65847.1 glycosyl transferase family 2 [Dysgonomonas alginatilytica]